MVKTIPYNTRTENMKTKEELTALKAEVEAVNAKLTELTEEELARSGVTFSRYEASGRKIEMEL